MANQKQVERLERSVEEWNHWRIDNPDEEIDLGNTLLLGADLTNANLSKANLNSTDLSGANLNGANISDANLSHASLRDTNLTDAVLSNANLNRVNFRRSHLTEGTVIADKWRLVHTLINEGGVERNLSSTDLRNADLRNTDLTEANLTKVNLSHALLNNTDLRFANLSHAILERAYLANASLNHAVLVESRLSYADLMGADLSHTCLDRANFSHARLREANLCYARLTHTQLSYADLSATQVLQTLFEQTMLTGACVEDWQIGGSTTFDSVQCDYIFRAYKTDENRFTNRLPVDPNSTFKPGEFEQWIKVRQGALDTIDITFTEGIDWQAFFQSLQAVRQQHPEANVTMKAVEEEGGAFVARLKVETELTGEERESLKALVERDVKAFYDRQLAAAHGEIRALERSLNNAMGKLAMTSKGSVAKIK